MEHLAFEFDWNLFEQELAPILVEAVADDTPAPLIAFISQQRNQLTDPYGGDPLPPNWQSLLEVGGVQELGDFALTKYYDVSTPFGLEYEWLQLQDLLSQVEIDALLGRPLGRAGNLFDPGGYGSYFQTAAEVVQNMEILTHCAHEAIRAYRRQLAQVSKGLYVTF